MKYPARFVLNLLAPVPVAVLLYLSVAAIWTLVVGNADTEFEGTGQQLRWLAVFLIFGYLFAGLPSLAHALFMERRYRRGLDPRSRQALRVSTLSGLCAGFVIGGLFALSAGHIGPLLTFVSLGAAAGALTALLHQLFPAKTQAPETGSPAPAKDC